MRGGNAVTINTINAANSPSPASTGTANAIDVTEGWTFADRIDLPFVDDPNVDSALLPIVPQGYPDSDWSVVWYAWRTLTEFVQLPWRRIAVPAPKLTEEAVRGEINTLLDMARFERADALAEIFGEKDEFVSYFMALMMATPGSRPKTYKLLHMVNLFAAFTVMHFKAKFKRQRPSQICPALLPPLPVPGHASYPSGHSTQGHLIAHCAGFVLPAEVRRVLQANLDALADRIGRNREIAGVHYPSDTAAGVTLARGIATLLDADFAKYEACQKKPGGPAPVVPGYGAAVAAAQAEWR
jgi:hypothetical protein